MTPDDPRSPAAALGDDERATAILRALRRHLERITRKREAIEGDLAEARRSADHRRAGEALLAYLNRVPRRASRVTLPDPADGERTIDIDLDPERTPQANAARYFKRASKAARGLDAVPPRLRAAEADITRVGAMVRDLEEAARNAAADPGGAPLLARMLDQAWAMLPPLLRRGLSEPPAAPRDAASARGGSTARGAPGTGGASGAGARAAALRGLPARLQPRRLRTTEGWDVLIGRNNEGNDHLTHHLARPEDYWFHVHGCPGSHVVLRRGKGKNEPSKRTLEEVSAWAAFYSQARTAGKVPVIWTLKKYVRRPRKAPPGLAVCEREKTIMARPVEPPRSALADEADAADAADAAS